MVGIPLLLDDSDATRLVAEFIHDSKSVGTGGLSFTLFLKGATKTAGKYMQAHVFSSINFMQLIVYHPLMQIHTPASVQTLNEFLVSLATFDLFPTDDYYPMIFGFTEDRTDWQPLNDLFLDVKFETKNVIMNMGSLYLIYLWLSVKLVLIVVFVIITVTCNTCLQRPMARRFKSYIMADFWSGIFSYYTEAYIEIGFAVGISVISMSSDWKGYVFSYFTTTYFGVVAVVCFPFYVWYFLCTRYKRLRKPFY